MFVVKDSIIGVHQCLPKVVQISIASTFLGNGISRRYRKLLSMHYLNIKFQIWAVSFLRITWEVKKKVLAHHRRTF